VAANGQLGGLALPKGSLGPEARAAAAALVHHTVSPVLMSGLARSIDVLVGTLAGLLVYVIYAPEAGHELWYAAAAVASSCLAVSFVQLSGGYSMRSFRGGAQFGRVFVAWTFVFAFMTMIAFLAKIGAEFSRVWFTAWYASGLVGLVIARAGLAGAVRCFTREGLLDRRAVIVGGGKAAEDLIYALEAEPDNDIRICGVFDDRKDERSPSVVAGYPKLGTVAELVEFGRAAHIDLLVVSLPLTAENRLLQLLRQLWVLPVDIRLSAHTNKLRFRPRTYSFVGTVPFLDVIDKPIADWDVVAKWFVDRVLGSLALLSALPVMAAVALAVKLDSPGPILFKQKRFGFNNEEIDVYKFRSMHADQTDAAAAKQVARSDPRVTRVGRFIRKASLDELPQLFNVAIRGNLSLVGPRPHAAAAKARDRLYDEVVDGYFARHRVKPGVTGWAQINGWRGETDTEEKIARRVEHDLFYIENWSVFFDLYILMMTPIRLLNTENAY
jgi:Undecaprenyl-phosphate glucose phosphotransferase